MEDYGGKYFDAAAAAGGYVFQPDVLGDKLGSKWHDEFGGSPHASLLQSGEDILFND